MPARSRRRSIPPAQLILPLVLVAPPPGHVLRVHATVEVIRREGPGVVRALPPPRPEGTGEPTSDWELAEVIPFPKRRAS